MDFGQLKDLLIGAPRRYWITEPQEAGYEAYDQAAQKYGKTGEGSRADAAKHMAWQAEMANRTMLPKPLAVPLANLIGIGKEGLIDALGSAGNYALGTGGNPVPTWKNSLMDLWNNYIGASRGYSPEQAAEAAGNSTNSVWEALSKGLPYSEQ